MPTVTVRCPAVVIPGAIHVIPGDDIVWDNQTAGDIDVLIPAHGILTIQHLQIKKGTPLPNVPKQTVQNVSPGHYRYAVYCHHCQSFAVGGSEPEMIVP